MGSHPLKNQNSHLVPLRSRLEAVRRKSDHIALAHGTIIASLVGLISVFVALIAEQGLYLSPLVRTALLWGMAAAVATAFFHRAGAPLLRRVRILANEPDATTACLVGSLFPSVRDRLLNTLQILEAGEEGTRHHSQDLAMAAVERFERETQGVDFSSAISNAGSRRTARILAIVALVSVASFLAAPESFLGAAYRLTHPGDAFAAPHPFRLIVSPGDVEIVRGGSMEVMVHAEGASPHEVTLSLLPEGQKTQEDHPLQAGSGGGFSYSLQNVRTSFSYVAEAGPVRSSLFRVRVIDRPSVSLLRLTVHPPSYTALPLQQLDDNIGDVAALKGSRVYVVVNTVKDIRACSMVFNDGMKVTLEVDQKTARGNFLLMKPGSYRLLMQDSSGNSSADPVDYTLKPIADEYPSITLVSPASHLDVTDKDVIPVIAKITDDYGFSRMRLAYKLVQSRYEQAATDFTYVPVSLPGDIVTEAVIPFRWDLAGLHLVPEDVVSYYVEVFDNDRVSGPKSSVSEVFTMRLPSLEEVLADVDRGQHESIQSLEESLKAAEDARKEVQELIQETRKDQQKIDWQNQKKTEQLAKQYEDIRKKLDDVQANVDRMSQELQKNQVLSKETLEKYQELQHLMEEMNSPEVAEAMKQLQQSLEQMTPDAMRQALEKFSFSEDTFRKGIERTMNLLKRIQVEQKLDSALRREAELKQELEALAAKTGELQSKDEKSRQELAKAQEDLKRAAEELQKEMQELQKRMEEFPGEMPLAEMEALNKELEEAELGKEMERIARQLSAGDQSTAGAGQQRAMQRMDRLMEHTKKVKESLQHNQQREVMNAMRRSMNDLLELSRRQEALKNDTRGLEPNSAMFRENAEEQMNVMRDLSQVATSMASLSQKTFAISPEMGKEVGDAMRHMGETMKSLELRSAVVAGEQQQLAMASLNKGAALMQGALQAMSQGGGQGAGMAGFMQRLRQLSGMQEGINKGTGQAAGMSEEHAAAMARLAGEQGMVRKSLEQLQREAASSGELQKMLGDLSSIAQEMREVQTDLSRNEVNAGTARRQQRILSRLLDAQRSAQEREREQRRRAESGRNVVRASPAELDRSRRELRDARRRDLLRMTEQGYTRDYEALIRKYFEALDNLSK